MQQSWRVQAPWIYPLERNAVTIFTVHVPQELTAWSRTHSNLWYWYWKSSWTCQVLPLITTLTLWKLGTYPDEAAGMLTVSPQRECCGQEHGGRGCPHRRSGGCWERCAPAQEHSHASDLQEKMKEGQQKLSMRVSHQHQVFFLTFRIVGVDFSCNAYL